MPLPSIQTLLENTLILSAAELLAFAGGAIEVVPPPGDGKLIWPLSAMLIYNFGGVDFAATPNLDLEYHGSGATLTFGGIIGFTGQGASAFVSVNLGSSTAAPPLTAPSLNVGLDLVLTAGAFALAGIGTASVTAGGTGYAIGDTGTITTGDGTATYEVLTVSGLGAVLTFKITFPGSTYAVGAGQATATGGAQPGVGINFTVDVLTLVNGNGSLKVTTLYKVIDVP